MNKGGGGKTQTTTENQSTTYAPWTQQAGQNLFNLATNLTSPFLQQSPYGVAGFTPDQLKAMDLSRTMAQGAFTGSPTAVPMNAAMTPASMSAATSGGAQLGAGDYEKFLNPFISGVVDQAANKARGELRKTEADIGARYAAAGAFGGGREVLARGKAQKDFDANLQATTAQLLAQGFDAATANAMANTQLRQQTAESNASREQDARSANAQFQQAANSANQGYGLQAAQIAEAMRNGQLDRQSTVLQQLLGTGALQQGLAQNSIDLPIRNLQLLLGAAPGVFDVNQSGTTTAPNNKPSAGQNLLSTVAGIASLPLSGGSSVGGTAFSKLFGLSDRETKTNIEKLGKDPETGETLYAYDYKEDVKEAKKSGKPMGPKRVSPMAQDIERAEPGSTKRVGGKLVVKGR